MPLIVALLITAAGFAPDPISIAVEHFNRLDSYRVMLKARGPELSEIIRYYYRRPGFVRMELVKPFHKTILLYDPRMREVTLIPLGWSEHFAFTLDPGNRFIRSSGGHRIDESDIGALLKSVQLLQKNGVTHARGKEDVGERRAIRLDIKGKEDYTINGIHAYHLWLDEEHYLPLKVAAFDMMGRIVEEVLMDDLEINIDLPEDFFHHVSRRKQRSIK